MHSFKNWEISQIFPSFNYGIFSHMTRLDQSRASENICQILSANILEFWGRSTSLVDYRSAVEHIDKLIYRSAHDFCTSHFDIFFFLKMFFCSSGLNNTNGKMSGGIFRHLERTLQV